MGAAPPMPTRSLFRRLSLINGLVFTAGTLALALSPATVSRTVLQTEIVVLAVGLAGILAINALLVRRSLAPLNGLTQLMQRVDLLSPVTRFPDRGHGDLGHLVDTFNAMLDRLAAERSASSAHALAAQEAERERIARELHDEIGQSLTVVLLGLKRAVDRAPADLLDDLHAVQETVRASLDEVREVARRLRPGVLADLGLRSAMKALCGEFAEASGIVVTTAIGPVPERGADTDLVVYRIAQESLTNVARHADATRVEVTLTESALRIADNGRGGATTAGAGIRGMRERALLIGARLTIDSPPGGGTTVRLDLEGPS
ncbi:MULTISPECIES: sensor histidine kinase [Actinokineospora]|nr:MULTISPECIES: histidine kinase [Actinokineospora]